MTDFTAGTDLCFTKTSAHLLPFCLCTLGLYPELASLQTSPSDRGDISPALGCCGSSVRLEAALPSPRGSGQRGDKAPLVTAAVAGTGQGGQGIPCPWHPACPGPLPPKLSSCIYCLPKWDLLNPGPSCSYLTQKPSSGRLFSTVPHAEQSSPPPGPALSHSSSLSCGRASPQPHCFPFTASPTSIHQRQGFKVPFAAAPCRFYRSTCPSFTCRLRHNDSTAWA